MGDVVTVEFPQHRPPGNEQQEFRPGIVVGLPERLGRPRSPVVLVAPLTTDRGQAWATAQPHLYPRLPEGEGGLPSPSIALLDQTRSVSLRRTRRYLGSLSDDGYANIERGLARMMRRAVSR